MNLSFWSLWLLLIFAVGLAVLLYAQVVQLRAKFRTGAVAYGELIEAIRLTVEYVGSDTLPPIKGWAWYDVLMKYAPDVVRDIGTRSREGSNLVTHAQRELELLGEEDVTVQGYLRVIQAFADMGHSGGSASVAIPTLNALFQYQNLKPLTDDPDEWHFVAESVWGATGGIWQNRRNSEAFSNDNGKTYYLLSEGGNDKNRHPLHESVSHVRR